MLTKEIYYVPVWLWLSFGILLFLACFYLYIQHKAPKLPEISAFGKSETTSLDDFLSKAQNGDLILMSGDTRGEKTCRWCTRNWFSHVGLLFRESHPETKEDILYVFDCDLGQGVKDGVRVMPLLDKFRRYKGFRVGGWKALRPSSSDRRPTTQRILELVPKYLDLDFDDKILTWWVARKGQQRPFYHLLKNHQKVFCSELVASLLQDLGVLQEDRAPAWYCPGYFDKNRVFLKSGYAYGPTLYFDFSEKEIQKAGKHPKA